MRPRPPTNVVWASRSQHVLGACTPVLGAVHLCLDYPNHMLVSGVNSPQGCWIKFCRSVLMPILSQWPVCNKNYIASRKMMSPFFQSSWLSTTPHLHIRDVESGYCCFPILWTSFSPAIDTKLWLLYDTPGVSTVQMRVTVYIHPQLMWLLQVHTKLT